MRARCVSLVLCPSKFSKTQAVLCEQARIGPFAWIAAPCQWSGRDGFHSNKPSDDCAIGKGSSDVQAVNFSHNIYELIAAGSPARPQHVTCAYYHATLAHSGERGMRPGRSCGELSPDSCVSTYGHRSDRALRLSTWSQDSTHPRIRCRWLFADGRYI